MAFDPHTFEAYRPLLFSIAYRMLGSAMEAEDMVQEAYLRYERAADTDIQFPKAYLSKVITHLCLDYLKSAKTQREEYFGTWLPEPVPTDDSPGAVVGAEETISMAFMVLLESLTPTERAVFLLRDVFDYSYAEIAAIIGKSEANCRQQYRRAKQDLMERRPRFESSPEEQSKLVEGFMQAVKEGDVESLNEMLAESVTLYGDGGGVATAARHPQVGRAAVMRLLEWSYRRMPAQTEIEMAEINGKPSLLYWLDGKLILVSHFTIEDNRVTEIYHVLNPAKLAYLQARRA
jgi:RNA polymerase sigma-70 factor, ECF subfamily